jgi:hypothetical protein
MPHGDFSDVSALFCFAAGMTAYFKPEFYFNKVTLQSYTIEPMFDTPPTPEMLSLFAILGGFFILCFATFYMVRWNTLNGKSAAIGQFTIASTFAYQAYKLDGNKFVLRQQYIFAAVFFLAAIHFAFNANEMWTSATLKVKEEQRAAKKAKKAKKSN